MSQQYDVAIVGGGIAGLAHAWMAVKRGLSVLLLERETVTQEASVRNFGMIWPIGQPEGEDYQLALRSRELWLELQQLGVIQLEECGSLHVAHREDEFAVLEEFVSQSSHSVQLRSKEQTLTQSRIVNPEGLLGAMWSETELRVNPRHACAQLAKWLQEKHHVTIRSNTSIVRIEEPTIYSSAGEQWSAERIIVCSGRDLQTLYPLEFNHSGIRLCKIHMLMVSPQREVLANAPHIASGLTLRHYHSFRGCRSLPQLIDRVASETPQLDLYGIHVMASQLPSGDLILGDSHHYDSDITPFNEEQVDHLILRELQKILKLDHWTISQRWFGIYPKYPQGVVWEKQIGERVHLFNGLGGTGMTMTFGLAEQSWQTWMGS